VFVGKLLGAKFNDTVELPVASATPVTARTPAAAKARTAADRLLIRMY